MIFLAIRFMLQNYYASLKNCVTYVDMIIIVVDLQINKITDTYCYVTKNEV